VGIESLIGSHDWFSQVLGPNNFGVHAIGQAGINGKSARLNWLLSIEKTGKDPLPELIDHMGYEAGLRGAKFITAAAKVDDCLFETLRRSGYCIYGWQTVWEIQTEITNSKKDYQLDWRRSTSTDVIEIEKLQRKLLAPSVQSVTDFASVYLPDYVLQENGHLMGYAYCRQFNSTILIKPFLRIEHPEALEAVTQLIQTIGGEPKRLLLIQTSDQSWMTELLIEIGKQLTPREELMVKHFAVMEKHPVASLEKVRNGHQADTVRPFIPSTQEEKNPS
jgi:hypothetical protein